MAKLEQLDEHLAAIAADARAQLAGLDSTKHAVERVLHDVERAGGRGAAARGEAARQALRKITGAQRTVEDVLKEATDARARLPTGRSAGWVGRVAGSAYVAAAREGLQADVRELLRAIGPSEVVWQVCQEVAGAVAGRAAGAAFATPHAREAAQSGAEAATAAAARPFGDAGRPPLRPAASVPKVIRDLSGFLRHRIKISNGKLARGAWKLPNDLLVEATDPAAVPIKIAFAFPKAALLVAAVSMPPAWLGVAAAGVLVNVGEWVLVEGAVRRRRRR
jgi:hypothetical protein